ncbi:MAG: AEC family transporter [Lawsonibacter sp.]|jgi:hypothetical protein|nr:AEC family transporter [Lawsonibacter sp.]
MAGFLNAASACLVLMLLMGVGYLMGRLGWMTAAEKKFLNKYIVNIAVPANCVISLLKNLNREELAQAVPQLIAVLLGLAATLLLSMGTATLLRLPRNRWGVFVAMGGMSNTLFVGLPICMQLFGDPGVPYLMLYYLCGISTFQSVGVLLIQHAGNQDAPKMSVGGFIRNIVTRPPILGVAAALVMLSLGLELPETLRSFGQYIANSVVSLALIYCGFILYEVGLRNLKLLRGLPAMLVIRLAVAPVICWGFCQLFQIGGITRDVFLVESALPVISQVPVMAGAFGADEEYAAIGTCLSILCCFVSLPVLMLVIG